MGHNALPRAPTGPMILALLLASCAQDPGPAPTRALPTRQPGAPVAGVAEGPLDAPIGAPLGGYTGRCTCFGGDGEIDGRDTAYTLKFNPSVGAQTRPRAKVIWLENGDQDLVWLKTDAIFAFEGLHRAVAARLEEETGRDLEGKVVLSTTHSHAAPGGWDRGLQWFLGFDRYNAELFEREVEALTAVALDAWADREPVAMGLGLATDWDPADAVYRDRRGENNELAFFDDIPAGPYKDPNLSVLRIDRASDGAPKALVFGFGMHGTTLGGDNQLMSSEAGGHVELAVEEHFGPEVVVAWVQHGGGDASPAGPDGEMGLARMEAIGAAAVGAILDLWDDTPTAAGDIVLESVTHGIDSRRDQISVERPYGTLTYAPYDPDLVPDQLIFSETGEVLSPIDEFNTETGGAFCGEETALFPNSDVGGEGKAYASCADVGVLGPIIGGMFGVTAEEFSLPLAESTTITATMSLLGPLPIREPDGTIVEDDVLLAFLPGEATAMLTEQVRRLAAEQLGLPHTLPIAYSQDHMGYMLIPEDWLQGGYEPNINLWGPLQAEHVVEQMLWMSEQWLLTDALEHQRPRGTFPDSAYPGSEPALPTAEPDPTPDAGTPLASVPDGLVTALSGLTAQAVPDPEVPRVQGIAQLAWEGGDPGVDLPRVSLERLDGDAWTPVTTASGRPIDDTRADIILTTTPDPLSPADATQVHRWWAGWQAVGTDDARAALPLGTYRLRVEGHRYTGGAATWPWPSEPYELTSDPFDVVPARIDLQMAEDGLRAWIPGPAHGYRMIDPEGRARGANPTRDLTLSWETDGGEVVDSPALLDVVAGVARFDVEPPDGATAVVATDPDGNTGRLDL